MSSTAAGSVLLLVGAVVFGIVLIVRRVRPSVARVDAGPASAVLSYVAAAFGILLGFVIVFLLGEASTARLAIGDEATAIGTAFDEAQLFPDVEPRLQHALICYSIAATDEWPALADGTSSAEADDAYRALIATYGEDRAPSSATFQPAAATNSFAQIGAISTAREIRINLATLGLGPILWIFLIGGAVFVLILLFVASMSARPMAQAILLGLASIFTTLLLVLVFALNNPFSEGNRLVTPLLIEETTDRMITTAPAAGGEPCPISPAV
jgi:hypothetical protein